MDKLQKFLKPIFEAEDPTATKEKEVKEPEIPKSPEEQEEKDFNQMEDLPADDMSQMNNMDMGMGGYGMDENPPLQTKTEVGRVYELKKIHARLTSIESYLSTTTDAKLIKIREYVSKSIELFHTMISNIDVYKDKLDEIIVMYYKFLLEVYQIISKYYKKKTSKNKKKGGV